MIQGSSRWCWQELDMLNDTLAVFKDGAAHHDGDLFVRLWVKVSMQDLQSLLHRAFLFLLSPYNPGLCAIQRSKKVTRRWVAPQMSSGHHCCLPFRPPTPTPWLPSVSSLGTSDTCLRCRFSFYTSNPSFLSFNGSLSPLHVKDEFFQRMASPLRSFY